MKVTLVIYQPPGGEADAKPKVSTGNRAISKSCACFVFFGAIAWGAASLMLRNLPSPTRSSGLDLGAVLQALNASSGAGTLVDAQGDGLDNLQIGAFMAQLCAFVYAKFDPVDQQPYADDPFRSSNRTQFAVRDTCQDLDIVQCYDGLSFEVGSDVEENIADAGNQNDCAFANGYLSRAAPMARQTLRGPAFCVFNSSDIGLIFAFRGSLVTDDGVLESSGHLYSRSVSTALPDDQQGTALVHGGFWDAYHSSGAAEIVAQTLANSDYANLPVFFTGHSLGGAIALLAAHDLCMQVRSGSSSRREVHLYSHGKPYVGDDRLAESLSQMVEEATCMRTLRRYVLSTEEGVRTQSASTFVQLCLHIFCTPRAGAHAKRQRHSFHLVRRNRCCRPGDHWHDA